MTEYQRGNGGYTLSQSQVNQLSVLLDQQTQLPEDQVGVGAVLYNQLLADISQPVLAPDGQTWTTGPLPGVDLAVWSWINGAASINAGIGFASDFIRKYTSEQLILREGSQAGENTAQLVQKASNLISFNVIQDIIDHNGILPGIEGIGTFDAGAAAPIFADPTNGGTGDQAGWSGALLFPYLGESAFYHDWLLNAEPFTAEIFTGQQVTFKHVAGT